MASEDWARYYAALDCHTDASWQEVRRAYRSKIKQWHPDHSQDSPARAKVAEEQSKTINAAYKSLAAYYKKNGFLPLPETREITDSDSGASVLKTRPETPFEYSESAAPPYSQQQTPNTTHRRFTVFAILVAAVLTYYFLEDDSSHTARTTQSVAITKAEKQIDQSIQNHQHPSSLALHQYFTIGSSVGELYSIQGIPTRTEGDVWYYGKSRVLLAHGRVVSWDESPSDPLHANLHGKPHVPSPPQFLHLGMTKDEVRNIQGAPERETPTLWEYGMSRIYFDGNRVSRWEESPLTPLKLER